MKILPKQIVNTIFEEQGKIIPIDLEGGMEALPTEESIDAPPMFEGYMRVIEMMYPLSSMLYGLPNLKKHSKKIRKYEKVYQVGSPFSPILDSYFSMWEFFDAEIEESGETFADVVIALGKKIGLNQDVVGVVNSLRKSMNSVYVVEKVQKNRTVLRSLITQKTYDIYTIKEMPLRLNGRYLIRLLASKENKHLIITPPYSLEASEKEWKDFFMQQFAYLKKGSEEINYQQFMKRGKSVDYWLEYIKTSAIDLNTIPIILKGTPK